MIFSNTNTLYAHNTKGLNMEDELEGLNFDVANWDATEDMIAQSTLCCKYYKYNWSSWTSYTNPWKKHLKFPPGKYDKSPSSSNKPLFYM